MLKFPIRSADQHESSHINTKAVIPRREAASVSTLALGGIAYFLLCLPSIGQRGYPPLHPFWWAMTLMWVFPLLVSCWFDSWSFPARRRHLWCYLLVTAFVNSGTPVTMVPKGISLPGMALATIFVFGPVHSAVGFGIEAAAQWFLGRWRILAVMPPSEGKSFRFSLLSLLYFQTILTLTLAFPLAFCRFIESDRQNRARRKAESDWTNAQPILYGEREYVNTIGAVVEYEIDRETGLRLKHPFVTSTFATAYNNRIQELLREEPSKTLLEPAKIPAPETVASLLAANDLEEVTAFPQQLSSNLAVSRHFDGSLIIDTGDGQVGFGDGSMPVYVGRLLSDEEFIAIRNGKKWLGIYTKGGKIIASARQ